MLSTVIAIIGALTGLGSLWFTERQWRKINRKIAMLNDAGAAIEILPAWYTGRMMMDQWSFGLKTIDGSLIAISTIHAISDDGKWMDVELLTEDEVPDLNHSNIVCAVAEDRRPASVQIDKVVAAYDIITS
ncbi:hypothetical protein [Chromohalobacter sp. 48-RD10]|uniref:hypothetical protein n=1 Tax=Chromohalobacter sp. 48-RD10 TaxID=2994063 RepID=UPI0024685A38|nr:hypothetical protein [Chromohalobacter sp. 48-RD10]